jgi:hypothetical protein
MASQMGHTDVLALLLANKADIKAVQNIQIFIATDNELQDFYIAFFIFSTIIAHENMNYN